MQKRGCPDALFGTFQENAMYWIMMLLNKRKLNKSHYWSEIIEVGYGYFDVEGYDFDTKIKMKIRVEIAPWGMGKNYNEHDFLYKGKLKLRGCWKIKEHPDNDIERRAWLKDAEETNEIYEDLTLK